MRRCFELLAHMDNVTILSDDDRHYSPVKKNKKVHRRRLEAEGEKFSVMLVGDVSCDLCKNFMRRGLTWGQMRLCFESVAYADDMLVFNDGR